MKTFPAFALLVIGLTAVPPTRAVAQPPGGFLVPPRPLGMYRPVPPFAPPPVPPPRVTTWVGPAGRQWVTVQRFVPVWSPRQGRWVLVAAPVTRALAPNQLGPVNPNQSTYSAPSAMGTSVLGSVNTNQNGYSAPSAMGTSTLQPPYLPTAAQAPVSAMGGTQLSTPPTGDPRLPDPPPTGGPQPLFAENLGIYYEQVRYNDGTFGARLTSSPVANAAATQVPLDAGDVIIALDGQRFQTPDDIRVHRGQTTVDFIDPVQGRQQGVMTIP